MKKIVVVLLSAFVLTSCQKELLDRKDQAQSNDSLEEVENYEKYKVTIHKGKETYVYYEDETGQILGEQVIPQEFLKVRDEGFGTAVKDEIHYHANLENHETFNSEIALQKSAHFRGFFYKKENYKQYKGAIWLNYGSFKYSLPSWGGVKSFKVRQKIGSLGTVLSYSWRRNGSGNPTKTEWFPTHGNTGQFVWKNISSFYSPFPEGARIGVRIN